MFNWANFLTYVIISTITPGPNNIMAMSNGSRLGFKKSLPFSFGVFVGCFILMSLSALFCSLLNSIIPFIKTPMMIIGAIYMLNLARKIFISSSINEEENLKSDFLSGLLLQFVNPKVIIYALVTMQTYIIPVYNGQVFKILPFTILLPIISVSSNLLWLAFGSIFKTLFSKYSKITNTVMALLLVYCAISLFI
ncbi:LysE family transporter [Anaerosphaera multitolerans]|uniref:Lysine transporter LysE n=1 Tax=Anaerosphaera multitolerans TaxID=2487351 RepID=A0A437S5A3_9FIRM|nr:LysE family transporter [Anaerosphaera multitolerans]RVU54222.1 lysine transporter LysE [Anaerosphaera multitolerans]